LAGLAFGVLDVVVVAEVVVVEVVA